jgi:hypothetical protein
MLELKVLVSIFMLTMSAFFHKCIVLLIGFCRVHTILLSVITMSWSDRPGSGLHLLTNDGLLVINRSRVLFFLVGKFTICSNKQSLNESRKSSIQFCAVIWTSDITTWPWNVAKIKISTYPDSCIVTTCTELRQLINGVVQFTYSLSVRFGGL